MMKYNAFFVLQSFTDNSYQLKLKQYFSDKPKKFVGIVKENKNEEDKVILQKILQAFKKNTK